MPRSSPSDLGIIDPVDPAVAAIADPTRWRILNLLGAEGERTATMLAARMPVSRPAIAKHLRILVDAGLVRTRHSGREVYHYARSERLARAGRWLARVAEGWSAPAEQSRPELPAEE